MEAIKRVDDTQPPPAPEMFPIDWDDPAEAGAMWTLDATHTPHPMTPLDFDLRLRSMAEGINRAYCMYRWPVSLDTKLINTFVYYRQTFHALSAPDFAEALRGADAATRAAAREVGSRWESIWLPEFLARFAPLSAFDLRGASLPALIQHFAGLKAQLDDLWEVHFYLFYAMVLAICDFEDAYRELFPDASPMDSYDLLAGFPNKSVEGDILIAEIARTAARSPALRELITTRAPAELPAALAETADGRALWSRIHDYLGIYGERSDNLYLDSPSWGEDSTLVLRRLRDAALKPENDLAADLRRLAEQRESRVAELRASIASHPHAVVDELEVLLKAAQAATVLSEDHNFWMDCKIVHHARRVSLELGERLTQLGLIGDRDEVFYLQLEEILALGGTEVPQADFRARIAERRAYAARFASTSPPPMVGRPAAPPIGSSAAMKSLFKFLGVFLPPEKEGELRGMPGSRGRVKGPARVVRTLEEAETLRPGDILIAPGTMPSWTPYFATAAAIVTNAGGVLCHGAVVAREYRIPAVVGTLRATEVFRDGQLVEVDGDAGVVRLVASS